MESWNTNKQTKINSHIKPWVRNLFYYIPETSMFLEVVIDGGEKTYSLFSLIHLSPWEEFFWESSSVYLSCEQHKETLNDSFL